MPTEFTCDMAPGIGPIMVAFDAGISPILDAIKLVLDFDEAVLEVDAELVAAFALGPVGLQGVSLLAWIDLAASLPPMPAPFEGLSGLDIPNWNPLINGQVLLDFVMDLMMLPVTIIMGIVEMSLPITAEVVIELLPIAAELPSLATCLTESLSVLG